MPALLACGGKLTFRPLGRNLLHCNQIPRLTQLSARQAETFRSQAFGLTHPGNGNSNASDPKPVKAADAMVKKPVATLSAQQDYFGDCTCPHCSQRLWDIDPGARNCWKCGKPIFVIAHRRSYA